MRRCRRAPYNGVLLRLRCCTWVALCCMPSAVQASQASQSFALVAQLEAEARQRLAARHANGALAAYQKLAGLVPNSARYQDEIGFLLAATNR